MMPILLSLPIAALACAVLLWPAGDILRAAESDTGQAGDRGAPRLLTTAKQVRQLSLEDAKRNQPVRIRGVITFHEPAWFLTFVQDESAGIYVAASKGTNQVSGLSVGQFVEVEGGTSPGLFAPFIDGVGGTNVTVRILGTAPLPQPAPLSTDPIIQPSLHSQRVEVRGVARAISEQDGRVAVEIDTRAGVPAGNYGLLVYSVGFDFQTIYDQAYELVGAATYPVFHVRAQAVGQYRASPGYRRMSSTDPNARDSGNYVMFENVSPDGSGNFTLNMTPEPPATPGVPDAMPAVNAMQLVRIVPPLPVLGMIYNANGTVTVSWGANAAGYTLKSTASLGPIPAPVWNTVGGSPNPVTVTGSINVSAAGNNYFRLEK